MKPFDYYSSKEPWPKKSDYEVTYVYDNGEVVGKHEGSDKSFLESAYRRNFPGCVIQKVLDEEGYKKASSDRRAISATLQKEFEQDLFAEFGVLDNPKRDACYAMAWERGHAYGYSEVYSIFSDLVKLILPTY